MGLANVPSNFAQGTVSGLTSIANAFEPDSTQLPQVQIPRPYEIPPAQTFSQHAADIIPGLLSTVATAALPGGLATKTLSLLGAGPAAAALGGSFAGGGFVGLPSGQAANTGAQFGAMDLLMKAPIPGALKALGMFGIPMAGEAMAGRDPLSQGSLVNSAAGAIVPWALGHYADHLGTPPATPPVADQASTPQPGQLLRLNAPPQPGEVRNGVVYSGPSGDLSPDRSFTMPGYQDPTNIPTQEIAPISIPRTGLPAPRTLADAAQAGDLVNFNGQYGQVAQGQSGEFFHVSDNGVQRLYGNVPDMPVHKVEGVQPEERGDGTRLYDIDPSITGYHGTPHTLDPEEGFDFTHMGTGQGDQAFGYGAYIAQEPKVADTYAPDWKGNPGNKYTVQINRPDEHFMDWSEPLADQSDHVKAAVSSLGYEDLLDNGSKGADLYDHLLLDSTPKDASAAMSAAGIAGFRYPDNFSKFRSKADQTSNFVVFDPKDVEITHRNGEPLQQFTPPLDASSGSTLEPPTEQKHQQIASLVGNLASNLKGVKTEVLHNLNELQPDVKARTKPGYDYEGFHDRDTGTTYLFTDNLPNVKRASEVFAHETGHYGQNKILPSDHPAWQDIANSVIGSDPKQARDIAQTYFPKRFPTGKEDLSTLAPHERVRVAREYTARLAENPQENPGLWQQIVQHIRNGLRAIGFVHDWSDEDIRDLVRRGNDAAGGTRGVVDRAIQAVSDARNGIASPGRSTIDAARRKPLTPQEQDEYRGLKKQSAVSPDLLTSTQKTRMSLLEKAMPKEGTSANVEQPVREAYNLLKAKSGMPAVAISDLARESGRPMEEVKSLLQRGNAQGKVVLSSGDWSLSGPEKRAGAIDTPAQKGNLLARFNSEEAIDPSLPRRLDEEAAKAERGRGGLIGRLARKAEINLGLSATPESKLATEKGQGLQQLLTKQVNQTSEALRKAKDALPKGRSLFTPAENDALHTFQTSKGTAADIAKFKAAGIPKVGEDYGLAHKAAQQAAGENRAQAEGGQRAAAIEKNLTYTRRAYELLSNPALYAKKFARGDYDAKLDDVVKLWLQKPGFTNLDAETMRQDWEQYLTDLRTGTPWKQGSGSEKISQSLYTAKKDLTNSQWDAMKGLERDSRLNPAQQSLVQDAVKNEHLTPTIREQLDKLSNDTGFSKDERSTLTDIAAQETVPPEVRAVLGEYVDPVERIAFTTAKSLRSVRQTETLNQIADSKLASGNPLTFETVEDWQKARNAATGDTLRELLRYKQLPDQDGFGKLAGRMAHVSVRDALNDINQGMEAGGDAFWGKIQKVLKLNATVLNPATHAHWWLQMPLMFAMARVYNPLDWLHAGNVVMGSDPAHAALRDELIRNNIVGAGSQKDLGLNAQKIATPAGEDTTFEKIKTKGDKALEFFGKLYGRPDDIIRTAAYLKAKGDALKAGMADQQAQNAAITYTNRYTFNYGATPRFTKWASNVPGLNPFLSYSSELTRITKNLAQDVLTGSPGDRVHGALNLALMAAVPLAASLGSSTANLSPQDQLEWDRMRKLEDVERRGAIKFVLGRDQKTGRYSYIDVSPFIPAGDTFSMSRDILRGDWKAFAADQPAIGLSHSPIASLGIDLSTGKNNATGQGLFTPADYAQRIGQSILPPLTPGVGSQAQRIARGFTPNQNGGLGLENPRTGRIDTPLTSLLGVAGIRAQSEQPGSLLKAVQSAAQNERESARAQFLQVAGTNADAGARQAAAKKYSDRVQDINRELLKKTAP